MSIFIIGGVRCEVWPFNVDAFSDESELAFARHKILQGSRQHEKIVHRDVDFRFGGKVFPRALGGEAELELLDQLHQEGSSVLVMQGPRKRGWFKITKFKRVHRFIDSRGVGRAVDFTIELENSGKPNAAAAANMLTRLFGYA